MVEGPTADVSVQTIVWTLTRARQPDHDFLDPFTSGRAAGERQGTPYQFKDFRTENGSSQDQNLALAGLLCYKLARQRVAPRAVRHSVDAVD